MHSGGLSCMVVFALRGVIYLGGGYIVSDGISSFLHIPLPVHITAIPLIVAPIDFLLATRFHIYHITCLYLVMILLFFYVPARLLRCGEGVVDLTTRRRLVKEEYLRVHLGDSVMSPHFFF